jgi:ribosomal protein S8
MFVTLPLKNLLKLISNLNSTIKKGSSSFICKVSKSDFKYLDCLTSYGYIYYTLSHKSNSFINNKLVFNFYFVEIFFTNYLVNYSSKPSIKYISIVSKPVHILSVNKFGYLKNNIFYSFLKSNRDTIYFLSTSKGILPHYLCKKLQIGGIVLFKLS